MKRTPITRLNRRLIYICLMASALVAIPLIVIPMARTNNGQDRAMPVTAAQAFVGNSGDAFAISGTERFPKNYAAIKEFEKETAAQEEPEPDNDPFAKAFGHLGNLDKKASTESNGHDSYIRHQATENPWQEARKAEQKRRAFDHFEARRSDIMFVDNSARKNGSNNDEVIDAVKRTLDIAEKQMNPEVDRNDMFFGRNGTTSLRGPIGKIKEPQAHMVSEGTLIPTILLSEIDTSLPGPILARVSHNIWDSKTGQTLLIPQNSQLIGEYSSTIGHGQTRAQILWTRIIFPNQQSVNLGQMVGVDKKGTSGTNGSVNNHYDKVALGLILTTALGGGVRMTQGKYDPNTASMGQEFGNALAQETARLGNKITDKMLSIPPTIKVPMGQRLNVFVEQDLSLQPYAG